MAPPITLPFSGSKLRALRERRGMEQQDLSQRTARFGRGVAQQRISQYELGRVVPSVAVFAVLVKALDCDPADLLESSEAGAA